MSSFISPFRPLAVWLAALAILVAIEAAVQLKWNPNEFDRTSFLQFGFARGEPPQRAFMYHKIKEFSYSEPVIVQSGDSSGFYGIKPLQIMQHLPDGVSYLNMSCCANLGFRGYYNVFQYMAERNSSVRYFVLHFTPYTMPQPELWDDDGAALWGTPDIKVFGNAIYQEFMGPWRMFQLPLLAYRRQVTDFVYYLGGLGAPSGRPLLDNPDYFKFLELFQTTRGWMPENDVRVQVPPSECMTGNPTFFDASKLERVTYLEHILGEFASLAQRHGVTLVVVFQPVACKQGPANAMARDVIERFKRAHPDVEVPFPLIETWPSEVFSVPAHVKHEFTDLINDRLGKAMAEIVARRH